VLLCEFWIAILQKITSKEISPPHTIKTQSFGTKLFLICFVGLALVGKDIVFIFIIEYRSLRDFGNKSISIGGFF